MAKKPIKAMISSSVYGSQSLLRQTYASLLGFGYNVVCSSIGTVSVNPKKSNLSNCLQAVKECDIFIGFIRPIYGSGRDSKIDKSITHIELEKAIELNLPSLAAGSQQRGEDAQFGETCVLRRR